MTLRKSLALLLVLIPTAFKCIDALSRYTFQDADSFWHLASGKQILSLGYVPTVDTFSFNSSLTDWVNINWLSQIIFFKLYQHFDYFGISYISFFALGLLGILFFKFCQEEVFDPFISCLFFVLTVEISLTLNLVRPQTFSFMFFTILSYFFLWKPDSSKLSKLQFIFLTGLLILWGNLHGGVVLGYFVLTLSSIGSYINNSIYQNSASINTRQIQYYAAMLISALAFYFHPLGYKALFYIINYSGNLDKLYYSNIPELMPFILDFHTGPIVIIPVLITLYICVKKKLDLNYELILPNLSLLVISLNSVRFLPFFFVYSSPSIVRLVTVYLHGESDIKNNFFRVANKFNSILTTILLCVMPIFLNYLPGILGTLKQIDAEVYPTKAVNYFSALPSEKNRVFADYNFAGYVIWKASDKVQVFIDGRGDLHSGIPTYKHYKKILTLDHDWRNILEGYKIDYMLLTNKSPLIYQLEKDGWKIVHKDEFFKIAKNPKSS